MLTPASSRPDVPEGYLLEPTETSHGLLPWSWADERLDGRYIWWLATVRPDSRPHLMPVWAVWLGDGVAFSTSGTSRKAKNIAANPNVSITPERGSESVIIEGVVETLPDSQRQAFFDAYLKYYKLDVSEMQDPVNVVRPKTVFGFVDEEGDHGFPHTATRWSF